MNARLLVVPLLASVAACATEQDAADVTQIGARVVSAESTRVEAEPVSWATAEARLAELELDGVSSVLRFVPDEGAYGLAQKLVRLDGCGIADGSAELDHEIRLASAASGTYQDDFVERGAKEPTITVGCELNDHLYRCNSSTTTIDFGVLGLAAKVTIQNDSFGIWSGSSPAFIGVFPFTVTCKGADCGRSPASDLFGMLGKSMPCVGLEVAKFAK